MKAKVVVVVAALTIVVVDVVVTNVAGMGCSKADGFLRVKLSFLYSLPCSIIRSD